MNTPHKIYPITQRGLNYFIVKYKDPDTGKWLNKRAPVDKTNEKEVEHWFVNDYKPTPNAYAPPATKTIQSLAEWWYGYRKDDPELHNRKGYIDNWVLGKSEDEKLPKRPHAIASINLETELEPKVCRDFIRSINRAPSTVRNIVQSVRTLIDDARKEQKIDFRTMNLFRDKIVLEAINNGEPVTSVAGEENTIYLNNTQLNALLSCKAIPIERHTRYLLAISTGLRDGELCGLMWRDLDEQAETINVERQLKRGKKGNFQPSLFKPPKKKSYRTLPLHPKALQALKVWRDGYQAYCGRKPEETMPVFPNVDGLFFHPHSSNLIRNDLKKAGQSELFVGMNDAKFPFDFHSTRRTFATQLDALNVDRSRISALMGHKAKGVTAKNYLAKDMVRCRKEVARIRLP